MSLRNILMGLVLLVLVAFVALNWTLISTPSKLDLGFATADAPLGLVMLFALGFVGAIFLFYAVSLRTSMLMESRRSVKELEAARKVANEAEASRFTQLKGYLEAEMGALHDRLDAMEAALTGKTPGLDAGRAPSAVDATGSPRPSSSSVAPGLPPG